MPQLAWSTTDVCPHSFDLSIPLSNPRLLERQRIAVRQPGAAAEDAARSALEAQLIRKDLLRMAEDLRHRLARMRREGAACGDA